MIDRVNVYRSEGDWCYSAWIGDEFDHSDELDVGLGATESEAMEAAAEKFPGAQIERVEDVGA